MGSRQSGCRHVGRQATAAGGPRGAPPPPPRAAEPPLEREGAGVPPEGEVAAAAFELFAAGKGPRDVAVALKMAPALAGRLFEEWVDLGEDRVIRGAVWARLQALLGAQLAPETLAGTVLALS